MEHQLPEWLRAPRQRKSTSANMAALSLLVQKRGGSLPLGETGTLLQFLPSSSASVTSRIEQFEHLTSSSASRQPSSSAMLGREMSSVSVRPFSVPVPCSQCITASESRQGIHFDDTSSESDSPSKVFLLLFGLGAGKIDFKGLSLSHLVYIEHHTDSAFTLWRASTCAVELKFQENVVIYEVLNSFNALTFKATILSCRSVPTCKRHFFLFALTELIAEVIVKCPFRYLIS